MDKNEVKQIVSEISSSLASGINAQIASDIEFHINGKTREMLKKLDDYIIADTEWKKNDKEWKDRAMPSIESVESFKGFGTVGTGFLKTVLLIAGSTTAIWGLFKFINTIH